MSVSTIGRRPDRAGASRLDVDRIGVCVLLLFPLAFAMSWPRALDVWQTGAFFDTDDAMRMVQVRDWMAGQGWFDLVAHRLDPPAGLLMHWSRVVDVPLSLLVRLFGLALDPVHAERLARLAFPMALQAAMIGATAWVAKILIGRHAVMPAALLVLMSGIAYGQFQPGRIDHHAPQILLLMLATGTVLRALDPVRARFAAATAALIALSLAISLENLPFFAILLAVPALSWGFGGPRYRAAMAWFAGGLGTALPLAFVATVPPARYGIATYDAFSIAHLTGLMAGAAALGVLALGSPWLMTPARRWGALTVAGLLVVGFVLAAYPAALHDPYAAMDPLIVRLWLSHVTEAQPIITAIAHSPDTLTIMVCPILMGALATLIAVRTTTGLARVRWVTVAALVGAGIGGAVWELRVTSSVGPLALLGGAWAVTEAMSAAQRRNRGALALFLPFGTACLFSTVAWAFVPVPDAWHGGSPTQGGSTACRRPEALSPLASLPPATAFEPVDSGSHLLAFTSLSVLAAPYHRDQHGIGLVLTGLSATPEAARSIVEGSGATLLLYCRSDAQMKLIADEAPASLAAALLAGRVPAWLESMEPKGGLYQVYRIR